MDWLNRSLPPILEVNEEILSLGANKDYNVLNIGPVNLKGIIKNYGSSINLKLHVNSEILIENSINLNEEKINVNFNLELLFENSINGDYKLSEFRDLLEIIKGNILSEIPISVN